MYHNQVLPSMYGCIALLSPEVPVRQPWDGKLLQPGSLRPEVVSGRKVLYDDMTRRWKTDFPEPLKRFHFIATICDPRLKSLLFHGISDEDRSTGHEWFVAELDSLSTSQSL